MQNLIKMLEIALDLNARLETLESHISPISSTHEKHYPLPPSRVFIVTYLPHTFKRFRSSIFKVQFQSAIPKKVAL